MKTQYVCTYVVKTAVQDDYAMGELPDTEVTTMAETANIRGDTLAELVENIGRTFCLDMEPAGLTAYTDENGGGVSRLDYCRQETADCDEPTPRQVAQWKAGAFPLYAVQFSFSVERQAVSPVSTEDVRGQGLELAEF